MKRISVAAPCPGIYYKDWGKGQPIVFSHGCPLSAEDIAGDAAVLVHWNIRNEEAWESASSRRDTPVR
jgi:hypothetical protein